MSESAQNKVVKGKEKQWLLPGGGIQYVALTSPAPCIVILVHGVNDIGEAFPFQEQGICAGLNVRLDRKGRLQPANYALPPTLKDGEKFGPEDVHPDPDKVYFARSPKDTTSPVIPFLWGFREDADLADTKQKHGEYVDRYGNRIDKRYAKNGGPFVNATNNIPDMFGPGFDKNGFVNMIDPESPTHPLLSAPSRNYMVLAAQRLAALIRIIRKESPNEPINIVAHSQGCFVAMLAHAILGSGADAKPPQEPFKADTLIFNNWPYSVDQPFAERTQVADRQQTATAREETLARIVDYVVAKPSTVPKFAELKEKGEGVVGAKWRHDANKERDNRGKIYLYYSPDDLTVGLANIQGIGWWGLYDQMLQKLGGRFLQRVFASAKGPTTGAPPVGSSPHRIKLGFKWNMASLATFDKTRQINAEELPEPFVPALGPVSLQISPIDAAVAVANPYHGKDKEGRIKDGMLPSESPEQAQARWLGTQEKNSYHSSIVSNPMHSEKATAYDLCVGVSGILKDNDLLWIQFLRAVADWRTNWCGKGVSDPINNKKDPSFPPPPGELMVLLNDASKVSSVDRSIIEGGYNYYCIDGMHPGNLPQFTKNCTIAKLTPYVVSQTTGEIRAGKKVMDEFYKGG